MRDTTRCVDPAATIGTSRCSRAFVSSEARGGQLETRVGSFNTWHHTKFDQVGNGPGSSNFGQVTFAFNPRVFQLGGKIYF